jgi:hypothetical protein
LQDWFGRGTAFFTRPFYNPATFSTGAVPGGAWKPGIRGATSNQRLATVLTCVAIDVLAAFEAYAAQLAWPVSEPFPDETMALAYAAGRTWAPLFAIVGFTLFPMDDGLGAQIGPDAEFSRSRKAGNLPSPP